MSNQVIFVAGAGFMGHSIAQVAATAGYRVALYDLKPEVTEQALQKIRWSLEKLKSKAPDTTPEPDAVLARISPCVTLDPAAEAALVIEAIAEVPDWKEELFRRLDKVSPEETVFATNTSAIPVSRLAAATSRPDRFCGMHFFAPVPLMKLVEIIRGLDTSNATIATAMTYARAFGKEPVEVKRDIAGFIVNRILLAACVEAMRVLESGAGDAASIDHAMRLGCGYKMGPLETCDLSGLDVILHAVNAIYEDTGDPKFKAPAILQRLVAAGHLGRKTGRGFYTYHDPA